MEYINTIYRKNYTTDNLTIYPGIQSLHQAWLKIHDFIFEYLYAHPDCNYEKNDDSLLCISENNKIVFNESMANNLAERIWKNRLTKKDGLIDVLGLQSMKNDENKTQWKNNVLYSWHKRLETTAAYINKKRNIEGEESFYGFVTLCAYICRLPNTIKDVMTNHKSIDFDEKLTLHEKEVPLVPTDEMTTVIIHIVSFQIASLASKNNIDILNFANFCKLPEVLLDEITKKNTEQTASRTSRKTTREKELNKQKNLQIVAFYKLFYSTPSHIEYLRKTFTRLFYELTDKSEINRNNLISILIARYFIILFNIFNDVDNTKINNEDFSKELNDFLQYENTLKEIKLSELIKRSHLPEITIELLEPSQEISNYELQYNEDLKNYNEFFKDIPSDFKDVLDFTFDTSTIPDEVKKQTYEVFQKLTEARENDINEVVTCSDVMLKLMKSVEIQDDVITVEESVDNVSPTLEYKNEIADILKQFQEDAVKFQDEKVKTQKKTRTKTVVPPLTMVLRSQTKLTELLLKLSKGGTRRIKTRRHKKTRKHNKKRVSRKYIR